MNLSLNFGQAGGVTAESLGIPAPDCGPKLAPILSPDGIWQCVDSEGTGAGTGAAGGLLHLILAGAIIAFLIHKGKRVAHYAKKGEYENII